MIDSDLMVMMMLMMVMMMMLMLVDVQVFRAMSPHWLITMPRWYPQCGTQCAGAATEKSETMAKFEES